VSVTPPKPKDELQSAADRLSRSAPNQWAEFIEAFVRLTEEKRDACVQSPADQVLLAQGKARQCVELLALFTAPAKQK
jgi:hypothetical protein